MRDKSSMPREQKDRDDREKKAQTIHNRRRMPVRGLAVWYAHPGGFLDPRDPSPRAVVGPVLTRVGDRVLITAHMTAVEVGQLRGYNYQQPQIKGKYP
jgi:hypothetical protein